MICPNKSHPVYQQIAAEYGEALADEAFVKNGYEIPESLEQAKEILSKPTSKTGAEAQSISSKIRSSILNSLYVQVAIYEKRKGAEAKVIRLKELINTLEKDFTINAILSSLETANLYTTEALVTLNSIKNTISKGLENITPDELSYLASQTNEIKDLLSTYSILQEAEALFPENNANLELLNKVMARRRAAVSSFKMVHEELVSQWLTNAAERVNTALEAKDKKEWRITKDMIKRLLKTATSDIDLWEELFGAQANSKDPITGLVASAIKEEAFLADQEDNALLMELMPLYEETPGDKNNAKKFNAEYIKEVEVREWVYELDSNGSPKLDANGNYIRKQEYVKRKAFHQEYLTDQFEKERREFLKKNLPTTQDEDSAKKRAEILQKWYQENTELVDTEELIERKKAAMPIKDFKGWFELNTKQINFEVYSDGTNNSKFYDPSRIHEIKDGKITIYTGEFIRPNKKWANPKYEQLKKDAYYMRLLKAYKDSNDKLPLSKQLDHGILPQVRRSDSEIFLEGEITKKAVKERLEQSINVTAYDTTRGLQTPSGNSVKFVPVYYTDLLPNEEVSNDLLSSVLLFSQNANRYNRMNRVQPIVALLSDIIEGNSTLEIDPRKVQENNSKGQAIVNAITENLRVKAPSKVRVNRALGEFLDKVVYGEVEEQEAIGNISINKISQKLAGFSSMTKLAVNFTSAINNEIFGNYSNFVEAVAGRYFSLSEWKSGQAEYMSAIPNFMIDLAAGYPKSKAGKLAMQYDAIQGEFKDEYGRNVSKSALRRMFSTNSLFFLQKSGEHHIQVSGMIAMMKATKVKQDNGTEITLWDAYDEQGKLKPGVKWSQKDQFALMQKLHKMNKELHGIYNKFDSPTLQRKWYGRLVLMFRKYMYSSFQRRFTSRYLDIEGADIYEGYFRVFWKALVSDIKQLKFNMLAMKNMSTDQKQAMYRAYTDMLSFLSAMVLFFAMKAASDDEEEASWLSNMTMLQSRRFAGDLMWYVNPMEFLKLTRTPAIALNTVEGLLEVGEQLFSPFEQYERSTAGGLIQKGDYKLEYLFYKNFPVFSGVYRALIPGEQLKLYNK